MKRRLLLAIGTVAIAGRARAFGRCMNLVFDGDSISTGIGATEGRGLKEQVDTALGEAVRSQSVAAPDRTVLTCLRYYKPHVAPLFDPGCAHNVIVFHAGDSDFTVGRDARHTYAAFSDYVAAAREQGWKVVVSTELQRFDLAPARRNQIEAYNKLLRGNQARAAAVVDFDTDPRLTSPDERRNRDLFAAGGIHPADAGYTILAAMVATAIKRVCGAS